MPEEKEMIVWEPFLLMERAEDQSIIDELQGKVMEHLIYAFPKSKDKEGSTKIEDYTVGLSKAGVDALCRELANKGEVVRELDIQLQEDDKYYKTIVKAGRYAVSKDGKEVLLDTTFGAKRQPKIWKARRWDKEIRGYRDVEEENPFAYEIAITKAGRNAKRRLIPESLAIEIIKQAWEQGKIQPLSTKLAPPETKITPEEDKLKNLRQQLHIKAKAIGPDFYDKEVKPYIEREFEVLSSADLNEEQIKKVMSFIEENSTVTEADKREAIKTLRGLGLTDDQIKDAISKTTGKTRGWTKKDLKGVIEKVTAGKEQKSTEESEIDKFLGEF